MKILFIYPDVITKMINFCPAIEVLSAVLKRDGQQVGLIHVNNEYATKYDRETILGLAWDYDLFAITSTSFNYKYANEIAGWLKETYPNILRVLGGYHATTQPDDFWTSNFDAFCVGEGEEPMLDLVHALRLNQEWTRIPNFITWRGVNPVRGFKKNLDELPYLDFDIMDTKTILDCRGGWLSISFARGCPFSCTFCYNHLLRAVEMGKDDKMSDYLRRRTAENAINELESLAKRFPVKFFNIDDDLLLTNKKWMRDFTDGYRKRIYEPFGIKYVINARADHLTEEMVQLLAVSGCKEARVGFETGNEGVRNELLNKKITDASIEKAFKLLKKYGVMSMAFAMMGVPGESWDTFFDTINATIRFQPALIRMTFLFPYKRTRIYEICEEMGVLKEGYEDEDNRDLRSPLNFDEITDQEIFCFRFLFPWYVNAWWHDDENYYDAIAVFKDLSLDELESNIPRILRIDKLLSDMCGLAHYRYYPNNVDYFELID